MQQAHEYGCRKSSAELGCYTWDSEQQQALKYFEHALQAPFDQTAYLTVINFLKPIDLKYYLENLTSLYDLFIKMILAHPNSFIARMTTHPFVIIDTHLTMIDDASLVNEWREARSAFDCDAKIDANDLHDLAARTVSLLQHPVQHKRARR